MKKLFLYFIVLITSMSCSSYVSKKECIQVCLKANGIYAGTEKYSCLCEKKEDPNERIFNID